MALHLRPAYDPLGMPGWVAPAGRGVLSVFPAYARCEVSGEGRAWVWIELEWGPGYRASSGVAFCDPCASSADCPSVASIGMPEGYAPRERASRRAKDPESLPVGREDSMTRAEALSLLGLREGHADAERERAFRRLAMVHHPDVGGEEGTMARIIAAREALRRRAC